MNDAASKPPKPPMKKNLSRGSIGSDRPPMKKNLSKGSIGSDKPPMKKSLSKGSLGSKPGMKRASSKGSLAAKAKKPQLKIGRAQLLSKSRSSRSMRSLNSRQTGRSSRTPDSKSKLKTRSDEMRAKGIKHGITGLNRADLDSLDGSEIDVYWVEESEESRYAIIRMMRKCCVWIKCLPEDPKDYTFIKNALRWMQWLALLADICAALVSIVTFNGVAYCCGTPVLSFGGLNFPWHTMIRAMTWIYLILVLAEIYPVVRKGFPFNLVNPLFGFIITIAMFFDDSKKQALTMWAIETFAVLCEFIIFRLKAAQQVQRAKDVETVGRLTKRKKYPDEDHEDHAKQIKEARQKYYQLKQDQIVEDKVLWYLHLGVYINIILVIFTLALVIAISQAGGLCITSGRPPNPFHLNQLKFCPACRDMDDLSQGCEVCSDDGHDNQCYFPYS